LSDVRSRRDPRIPPSVPAGSPLGVLTCEDFDVVFQPIVDLRTRRIFSYEALARCRVPEFRDPAVLFRRASAEGACGWIGRLIREVAFARCEGLPLFINLHPDELSARWLVRPDDPVFEHDHFVFLEVTESAALTHFELCESVLREVRSRGGFHLVVDDFGAGYSNLRRVVDLEPKIVKLDRALVQGLDANPRLQTLVRAVVELCHELGADVVAEGIETPDELHACIDAGADYGQGYLFARPAYPLPKASWPGRSSRPPESALITGRR
jgi:EAL domain-containing protein (putative c-di-GMP-specific phosphodiesterase class I)